MAVNGKVSGKPFKRTIQAFCKWSASAKPALTKRLLLINKRRDIKMGIEKIGAKKVAGIAGFGLAASFLIGCTPESSHVDGSKSPDGISAACFSDNEHESIANRTAEAAKYSWDTVIAIYDIASDRKPPYAVSIYKVIEDIDGVKGMSNVIVELGLGNGVEVYSPLAYLTFAYMPEDQFPNEGDLPKLEQLVGISVASIAQPQTRLYETPDSINPRAVTFIKEIDGSVRLLYDGLAFIEREGMEGCEVHATTGLYELYMATMAKKEVREFMYRVVDGRWAESPNK